MDEPSTPGRGADGAAATNGHGDPGAVPARDRQQHSVYMTGVLARALTAQLEELAEREQDATGWWFARSERQDEQ